MVTVTEDEIADTIAWLWRAHEQRVEGAGACAAAALRTGRVAQVKGPVAIVVSGGNIDAARHESLLK
jgi:threonine dehydratase